LNRSNLPGQLGFDHRQAAPGDYEREPNLVIEPDEKVGAVASELLDDAFDNGRRYQRHIASKEQHGLHCGHFQRRIHPS